MTNTDERLAVAAKLTHDDADLTTLATSPAERDPLAYAAALARTARLVEDGLRAHVSMAREAGSTWQQVGDALGVTKQAAQQRYGRDEA
jgi:hypothetical protein